MTTELAKAESMDFNIPEGYICTVDLSNKEGAIVVANALNNSTSLEEYLGDDKDKILNVKDFVTVPGVRARTGEQCINTHLVLEDGTTLFTQSDGIARSVRFIVGFIGQYISDGINLRVKEQKLANKNTLKTLEIVA